MSDPADTPSDFIEARLDSISVTNAGFIVFLKGDDETRMLPIFIGANEAQAIALALGDEPPPRPMTHDLLKTMLESLDAVVTRVDITHLSEGTFFGKVHVMRGGIEETEFDARPSDAIALAVRFEAPIFMARAVFDEAAVAVVVKEAESKGSLETMDVLEDSGAPEAEEPSGSEEPEPERTATREKAAAKAPSPLVKLRADLDEAVRAERYEDAARLRDALKRLGAGN